MSVSRIVIILALLVGAVAAFAPSSWLTTIAATLPFLGDDVRATLGMGTLLAAIFGIWFSLALPKIPYFFVSRLDKLLAVAAILLAIRAVFISIPYFFVLPVLLICMVVLGAIEWCCGEGLRIIAKRVINWWIEKTL